MEKHRGRYGRDLRVGLLAAVLLSACMSTPEAPTDDQAASMPAAQVEEGMSHTEDAQASIAGALILPLKSPIPGCEVAPIDLVKLGGAEFANPPAIYSTGGVLSAKLNVQYGQNQIGNCPVTLRSYNGSLVGPTLVITPGDTLRITLVNQLPAGAIAFTKTITPSNGVAVTETIEVPAQPHHVMNQLGAFNTTNLHVHGLHVSPAGNSDNVLLEIGPGQTFQYEIKVPKNQPPGTYWYHAHNHGSTATQVTSGMAGAIVITGDYAKVDLIKKAHERVFVLQQIAYDEAGFVEPATGGTWTSPFNPNFPPGYFSPCAWEPTLREHTINGQLFPKLEMAAGEVQRWRFIHAGVRESIGLELHGPFPPNATPTYTDVLSSPALTLTEIAADGIALGAPAPWKQVELEPGYRSDMLVQALKPGVYYLMDNGVQVTTTSRDSSTGAYTTTTQSSDALTCAGFNETPNFLAKVDVKSPVVGMPPAPFKLPAAWPASPMKSIISVMTTEAFSRSLGLTNTVSLTQALGGVEVIINPNNTLTNAWVLSPTEAIDDLQMVDFSVTAHTYPGAKFLAADHQFDPASARKLKLGNTDEWVVNTRQDSLYYAHPFHIHVNPFQTWRYGPDGLPQAVWRDTLLIRQGQPAYLFTRYQDYIGSFVYHCHILDHEDQGMMELVEVVP